MKIILSEVIKTFDGKDIKDGVEPLTLGKALANVLGTSKEGGKMKMFILAEKCYKENEAEFDDADLALIKRTVESSEYYFPIIAGQILKNLEK
jgi:hypothetical protein